MPAATGYALVWLPRATVERDARGGHDGRDDGYGWPWAEWADVAPTQARCRFDTVEERRRAPLEFRETYNATWPIERHGFRPPGAVRQDRLSTAALAA